MSMHQSRFVSPQTFIVTIVTMAMATGVLVILPINRPISLFLFTSVCKQFRNSKNYAV